MSIRCKNGPEHLHQSVEESRRCWYRAYHPVSTPPVAASPTPFATPAPPVRMSTPKQRKYIEDLGGDVVHAFKLTYDEASSYITRLLAEQRERRQRPVDPRLVMIKGMLDLVPDGYYATAPDGPGGHVDFVRITRPTRGKFAGALKIQTQHSERWKEALVCWPSGNWSVYHHPTIETLLLVIADYHTCAKRYSIEMQSCCVCGTKLTDDRSRHYLIGPDCDDKPQWKWVIEEVDDKNDGLSYEQLVARGLPTRIWQDKALAS